MGLLEESRNHLEEIEGEVLNMVRHHGDHAVRIEDDRGYVSSCVLRDISGNLGLAALELLKMGQIGAADMLVNVGALLTTLADLAEGKDFKKGALESLAAAAEELGIDTGD